MSCKEINIVIVTVRKLEQAKYLGSKSHGKPNNEETHSEQRTGDEAVKTRGEKDSGVHTQAYYRFFKFQRKKGALFHI